MKQKYRLQKDDESSTLAIREYVELENGDFSFVCEEIHDLAYLRSVASTGVNGLACALERPNMYPRQDINEKIARFALNLIESQEEGMDTAEILIHDSNSFEFSATDIDPEIQ